MRRVIGRPYGRDELPLIRIWDRFSPLRNPDERKLIPYRMRCFTVGTRTGWDFAVGR
jgi:hypothetical protein